MMTSAESPYWRYTLCGDCQELGCDRPGPVLEVPGMILSDQASSYLLGQRFCLAVESLGDLGERRPPHRGAGRQVGDEYNFDRPVPPL
jgi:hypothetical protein